MPRTLDRDTFRAFLKERTVKGTLLERRQAKRALRSPRVFNRVHASVSRELEEQGVQAASVDDLNNLADLIMGIVVAILKLIDAFS